MRLKPSIPLATKPISFQSKVWVFLFLQEFPSLFEQIIGWHGQTLFVRACIANHNGTEVVIDAGGICSPPVGGEKGIRVKLSGF